MSNVIHENLKDICEKLRRMTTCKNDMDNDVVKRLTNRKEQYFLSKGKKFFYEKNKISHITL